MARPIKCRSIEEDRDSLFFKPLGIPYEELDVVCITRDEFESIRLSDLDGLYQEEAAQKMGISRQTFGNILVRARSKIAFALYNNKAIRVTGGNVKYSGINRIDNPGDCPKKRRCCRIDIQS